MINAKMRRSSAASLGEAGRGRSRTAAGVLLSGAVPLPVATSQRLGMLLRTDGENACVGEVGHVNAALDVPCPLRATTTANTTPFASRLSSTMP